METKGTSPWKPMLLTTREMPLSRRGITLVELVIAMAISLAILFVLYAAYFAGVRSFNQEMNRFDLFWDAYRGLDDITDRIRNCDDVISTEADSINLWLDSDHNGNMEAAELIGYSLSGNKLMRTMGSESRPIVDNVEAFMLEYDNPGYPTLITVTLTVIKDENRATLEGKADIRNR